MSSTKYLDDLNDSVMPLEGFIYPKVNDKVVCLQKYSRIPWHTRDLFPVGSEGIVIELRLPGSLKDHHGYVGCVVYFPSAKRVYPAGIVIPWDAISDPDRFQIQRITEA